MTLHTTEVLDLSKENVQPLRQGRKAAHLKTALQAQTDPETQLRLQKQREKHENTIRMYEGEDPLQPYWNYVAWLEQSYTKLGRESNFEELLEDAISKFKDCDKYKQDPRFVQLMIKYINMQPNSLELYQLVYNQGMGTMCSSLYKAWAEELDRCNDYKRADQIYQLGIQCRAQPLNELQEAHVQFQLSIARRMLEGNIGNEQEIDKTNTRNVLSKLQSSKVKTTRLSKDTAGVFQLTARNSDLKNNGSGKFKVYEEDENDGVIKSEFKNKTEKLPKGSVADRENVMKADKWYGQKHKQRSFKSSMVPTTPSFQIHEDPEAACENLKTVIRPRALKIRKEEFRCPVAVFEDPDPTKKPMYPKHLVYVGGRDIQLEELRAAMYRKRREEKQVQCNSECHNSVYSEPKTPVMKSVNLFEKENEIVKVDSSKPEITSNQPYTTVCTPIESHKTSMELLKKLEITPQQSFKKLEIKNDYSHSLNEVLQKNESIDDALIGISERGVMPPLCSPSTSFTVNTRAAMNVIQQMWESPLPPPSIKRQKAVNNFDDSLFKIPQVRKSNPVPFNLFVDDDADKKPFTRLETPIENLSLKDCKKTPSQSTFPIFCDDLVSSSSHSKRESKSENKFSFPIYCEDIMPAYTDLNEQKKNTISKTESQPQNKFSFSIFDDNKPTCTFFDDNKKSQIRNNTEKLLFPDFCDDMIFTSTQKPVSGEIFGNGMSFPIFSDDGVMPLGQKVETRNKCSDVDKYRFPVDSDDDIPVAPFHAQDKAAGMQTPVQNDKYSLPLIIPVNLADTPLEPENKENYPPKNYATPVERRPLSGILTPATDVPVKELTSEESEEEDDYCKIYPTNNDFDDETCSTKAFALNLPSSTPFARPSQSHSRKSLVYNGSYIMEDNNTAKSAENSKYVNGQHLSLILENSKEQGSNSSGGGSSATNK